MLPICAQIHFVNITDFPTNDAIKVQWCFEIGSSPQMTKGTGSNNDIFRFCLIAGLEVRNLMYGFPLKTEDSSTVASGLSQYSMVSETSK